MINKSEILGENPGFLPKIQLNSSFMPNFTSFPANDNNNMGFLPPINNNSNKIWESIQDIKKKKAEKMQRKDVEERVFKALEKQTEMLSEIARKFKKQAEEDETKLLKKIKELERENTEILWQRRNEDIIQQKVIESKDFLYI
jgi:myo-inositol-1-phosphate synthase